jgi:hypothetical protein
MAYQKLQAGRAIDVIPSDAVPIPNPAAEAAVGTTTADGRASDQLIDANATFLDDNIKVGDIVYSSVGVAATVSVVNNDTTITVTNISTPGSAFNTGVTYAIYSQVDSPQNGCCLYVGDVTGGTDLEVRPVANGGDHILNGKIIFKGVNAGQFIPVNVDKVYKTNTTAASIIALW